MIYSTSLKAWVNMSTKLRSVLLFDSICTILSIFKAINLKLFQGQMRPMTFVQGRINAQFLIEIEFFFCIPY